jgi:hypothetical protein
LPAAPAAPGAAEIVWVGEKSTGIDAANFGHDWLLWLGISSSLCFGDTPLVRASRPAGARARSARPSAGPLRRWTAMRQSFPGPLVPSAEIPSSLPLFGCCSDSRPGQGRGDDKQRNRGRPGNFQRVCVGVHVGRDRTERSLSSPLPPTDARRIRNGGLRASATALVTFVETYPTVWNPGLPSRG